MNGYKVEEHMVTTEDGYMLTLHRIPNKNLNESKPAVFLGIDQTCFCQTFRWSCFGKLPDVVLPKNAKTNSKFVNIWLFL